MQIIFEIVCTFVHVQNINVHEVLGDGHKYFTYVIHTCSFTSMTPKVFLVHSYIFYYMKVLLQFTNILHLAATFVFHIYDYLCFLC